MARRSAGAVRRQDQAPAGEDDGSVRGWQREHRTSEGDFLVRSIPGTAARKIYRCPGCSQQIAAGLAHVVVWPADHDAGLGVADRRHWHTACWHRRSSRGGPGPLPW